MKMFDELDFTRNHKVSGNRFISAVRVLEFGLQESFNKAPGVCVALLPPLRSRATLRSVGRQMQHLIYICANDV